MIGLRRGAVTAIVERAEGLVRLEVDGLACVAYPRLTGPVALGDEVLVNAQARELGLGSGGFDVLVANLTRGLGLAPEPGAHVMTLPYTPLQAAVRFAEETDELAEGLDGMPVVLCTVHSQVAPVAAGLAGKRVAYVQVAGGALPVSLSDSVRVLKERGLVDVAVAAAPCLDGDVQCAGVAGALLWAAHRYEAVIASVGPGLVGTGSPWGHGALALADVANVAQALGGEPILAVRVSERDERERHRGVSHHSRAVLALASPTVPEGGGEGWEEACAGLALSYMGRGPEEEPAFFAAAFAAGRLAQQR
ncbi:MAG TPA: DUF3866 family protein [Gaiellaceae bacterium]|nr:DUF3866 family protein [Gaiellaceae bacterium]